MAAGRETHRKYPGFRAWSYSYYYYCYYYSYYLRDVRLVSRALTYGSACSAQVDSVVHRDSHRVVVTRGPECATAQRCLGGLFPFPQQRPELGCPHTTMLGGQPIQSAAPPTAVPISPSVPKDVKDLLLSHARFDEVARQWAQVRVSHSWRVKNKLTDSRKEDNDEETAHLNASKRCSRSGHGNRPFK